MNDTDLFIERLVEVLRDIIEVAVVSKADYDWLIGKINELESFIPYDQSI